MDYVDGGKEQEMTHSPVALFVYNRPKHTQKVLQALKENIGSDFTDLHVFSDGMKSQHDSNVIEVRKVIADFRGFKSITIHSRNKNLGLAESIISGIDKILESNETVIVLEDDIITSPQFLNYMNLALNKYFYEEKVISINAYMYPISGLPETFFLRNADCWGWATWKRGWKYFERDGVKLLNGFQNKKMIKDFNIEGTYSYHQMLQNQVEGKNSSWAIRWYASAYLNNKLGLYVGKSLIANIGLDNTGVHCGEAEHLRVDYTSELPLLTDQIYENLEAKHAMAVFQRKNKTRFQKRLKNYYGKIKKKIKIFN